MKKSMIIIFITVLSIGGAIAYDYYGKACTGSKSCIACKNCKYCKYCAKNGGVCGVCK